MNIKSTLLTIAVGFFVPLVAVEGVLDTTFNPSGTQPGTVTTVMGTHANANAVASQTDGKLVAAGFTVIGGVNQFAVARYLSTATPEFMQSALTLAIRQKYCSLGVLVD